MLKDAHPDLDSDAFFRQLDDKGRDMGVRFGPQKRIVNSGMALQAGEYARSQGLYHQWHEAVFKAYFTDCRNIGDPAVLRDVAEDVGLSVEGMEAALRDGTYRDVLRRTTESAKAREVLAAPTFFIEGGAKITGAQPLGTFRNALREVRGRGLKPL